jgi:hypothetical protein
MTVPVIIGPSVLRTRVHVSTNSFSNSMCSFEVLDFDACLQQNFHMLTNIH